MSITFKQFTSAIAEGKRSYSSQSYWKGDAEEAGFKIKKLSGEVTKADQTWGAFNDKDEKVGEFTEKEDGRGGWLAEGQLNEIFGLFKNNAKAEKLKADREKLKKELADKVAAHRAKQDAKRQSDYDDDESEKEDKEKKRSNSTKGTRRTSAAGGRAAERDWVHNM